MEQERESPIRTWGPTAAMVAAVGLSYGAMDAKLSTVSTTQQTLVSDVRQLRDARIAGDNQLKWVEDRLAAAAVSSTLIAEQARKIGVLESAVAVLEGNNRQIWPRLRALGESDVLFKRALTKMGETIDLPKPADF